MNILGACLGYVFFCVKFLFFLSILGFVSISLNFLVVYLWLVLGFRIFFFFFDMSMTESKESLQNEMEDDFELPTPSPQHNSSEDVNMASDLERMVTNRMLANNLMTILGLPL